MRRRKHGPGSTEPERRQEAAVAGGACGVTDDAPEAERVRHIGAEANVYEPSPEQIRAACLEIQREWTPYDFWRRSGGMRMRPDRFDEFAQLREYRICEVQVEGA